MLNPAGKPSGRVDDGAVGPPVRAVPCLVETHLCCDSDDRDEDADGGQTRGGLQERQEVRSSRSARAVAPAAVTVRSVRGNDRDHDEAQHAERHREPARGLDPHPEVVPVRAHGDHPDWSQVQNPDAWAPKPKLTPEEERRQQE